MNEHDCNILVVLDKERNVTKASSKLYISQPTLSYRLRQIEKNFDLQIFKRESYGLIPTPEGELIIQYARENLDKLESTLENLKLMGSKVQGTIKLGVASTYGQYILPELLSSFQKLYPDVKFEIITGISSIIYELFKKGEVHIAILRGDFVWDEEKSLLAIEPICIVSKDSSIQPDKLSEFPRIQYEMDSYLENIINEWWNDSFTKESYISMRVDSLETAKEMVRADLGYTILPGICLTREKELHIEPIKDNNDKNIRRLTWLYCRTQTLNFLAVYKFYHYLKDKKVLEPNDFQIA